MNSAVIPIDDDRTLQTRSRITGYAIANPGTGDVRIHITLVNRDGTIAGTLTPPQLNPLCPGCHVSRFLWEDLGDPAFQFKGSMMLTAEDGGQFTAVAPVLHQTFYTVIPVIKR